MVKNIKIDEKCSFNNGIWFIWRYLHCIWNISVFNKDLKNIIKNDIFKQILFYLNNER